MGIFNKEKRGMKCIPNEDGSHTCTPYRVSGEEKMATGTEVTIAVDPTTCKPIFSGAVDMIDEDEDSINKVANNLIKSCKKKGI